MLLADRLSLSKQIVAAAAQYQSATNSAAALAAATSVASDLDTANKNLFITQSTSIANYSGELSFYTGKVYTSITEGNFTDSANMILGNVFYPNNTGSLPSPLTSVWTALVPFALSAGVGKPLTAFGAGTEFTKNRGLSTLIGGLTSGSPLAPMNAAIVDYFNYLILEQRAIVTTDPFNSADAIIALSNLNLMQNAIVTFQTYLAGSGLVNYPALIDPLYPAFIANLTALTTALSDRFIFLPLRQSQLEGYLGTLTQDTTTGSPTYGQITSPPYGNGSYWMQWLTVGSRLNLMGGSLIQSSGLTRAVAAQTSTQVNIQANLNLWFGSIIASSLIADANNTNVVFINNKDFYVDVLGVSPPVWLTVGDVIYIASDVDQAVVPEINCKIIDLQDVDGNAQKVTLNATIPQSLLKNQYARLYKTFV